jgi:hypothetical protein
VKEVEKQQDCKHSSEVEVNKEKINRHTLFKMLGIYNY